MTDSYPLLWPIGRPRIHNPKRSKFKPASIYAEAQDIMRQLRLMGARDIVISSNMQYRNDGLPYTRQNVSDTGVAVYFKSSSGEEQCIPCDTWITLEENMRAIAKTIEAMRGIERWGGKELMNAAFSGFKALPATAIVTPYTARAWHEVLEVSSSASWDVIEAAYKRLLHRVHPDKGGSAEAFQELQSAFKQAKELNGQS